MHHIYFNYEIMVLLPHYQALEGFSFFHSVRLLHVYYIIITEHNSICFQPFFW